LSKKKLTVGVVVLFLGISVIPNVYGDNSSFKSIISSDTPTFNNIIYVDGDNTEGPWDGTQEHPYKHIQSAIDNASDDDTVFVHNGTYYENLVVNKTINLTGEDRYSTIVDGGGTGNVVLIYGNYVNISGFTISYSGESGRNAGIGIQADNSNIENNNFMINIIGLRIYKGSNHNIYSNIFYNNKDYGILLHYSNNNTIENNIFQSNRWGIYFMYSNSNLINSNYMNNSKYNGIWISRRSNNNILINNDIRFNKNFGIYIYNSEGNNINFNNISNNSYGVFSLWAYSNNISRNNFLSNKKDAGFIGSNNFWNKNYWNKSRLFPKIIIENPSIKLPKVDIDLNPANEPYNFYQNFNLCKNMFTPKSISNSMIDAENATMVLPSYFCWQDINGTDFTTSIKNQAPAPTCEAYALCASLETIVQYRIGFPFNCDLSETHLYFYSGGTCSAGGVLIGDAAEYLIDYGVPDEGCFPDPHRSYDYPFESIEGWENRTVKIKEWGWVDYDVESIKRALINHGPLVIHIMVRPGFNSYKRGIYQPMLGEVIGGHLITIIGYDDYKQCWIVKNSAGTNWGENGYVKVSYESNKFYNSFIWPFYGGTGILYMDGIYGNLMPDVPECNIENPKRYHTYLFGMEFPTILKDLKFVEKAIPRIIGWTKVIVNATNANGIKFYLDGKLQYVDENQPYECKLDDISKGSHTIEAIAFNDIYESKSICDLFVI